MISDILTLCKDRGISLTELAKQCGISKGYLSLLASGKRTNMNHMILLRIARALDISLKDLLSDTPFTLNPAIDIDAVSLVFSHWEIPAEGREELIAHLKKMEQTSVEAIVELFAGYEQKYIDYVMDEPFTERQIELLIVAALYNGELPSSVALELFGKEEIPDRILSSDAQSPDIYRLKVRPKHILDRFHAQISPAIRRLLPVLTATAPPAEAYHYIGQLCVSQNLDDFAVENYGNAVLYARAEENKNILEDGIRAIRSFPHTPVRNIILAWHEGMTLLDRGFATKALAACRKGLELNSEPKGASEIIQRVFARIHNTIGAAYLLLGKYKDAFLNFKESIRLWPDSPLSTVTYINIGTLMRRIGNLELAKNYFRLAAKAPHSVVIPAALSSLAQIAIDQKELDKARKYVLSGYLAAKRAKREIGRSELYVNLGLYYKETGKHERALHYLELAVKRSTQRNENRVTCYALLEMADVYIRLCQLNNAKALIDRLAQLMVGQGDLLLLGFWLNNKARAYLLEKNASIALTFLLQTYGALAGRSHTSFEYENCIQMLEQTYTILGKPQKAFRFHEELLKRQDQREPLPVL